MRVLVDLKSHLEGSPNIVQIDTTQDDLIIDGKYAIPVPVGQVSAVVSNPILDGSGVVEQSYANLLAQYPQFSHVYVNPLLTADNVAELDLDFAFYPPELAESDPAVVYSSRGQTGRGTGFSPAGQMPTHTALQSMNATVDPSRPGLLVSKEIDLSSYALDCDLNPEGADTFALFWYIYGFTVSHDINASYGALAGTNEPAHRVLSEVTQNPSGFRAYLSPDNGASWCQFDRFKPVSFASKTKKVRVAFANYSTGYKIYIASFGVFF